MGGSSDGFKKICSECPDYSGCEGICPRLEEELAKYTKELDYREVLRSNEDFKKVVQQDSYSNNML